MSEKVTVSGLSGDENGLVNALLKQLDTLVPGNRRRQQYYEADRPIRNVSSVVPPQYHRLGLALGWSAKAVDALARRCYIEGFDWADGDLDSLGLPEFAEENMLRSELSAARTKAFIHGVSFLVNTTGAEGEPASLLHMKDALNATGVWNRRARVLDSLISITERDDKGKPVAMSLYRDGVTVTMTGAGTRWSVADQQEHSYGMPVEPVIYRPQGRDFGYSRVSRPVRGLQDAAVRALIRMEGHMDIYSYPELWMLGADLSIFKNEDGTPKAPYEVMMGRIKGIPDDDDPGALNPRADVKQFSASSPEPHLAQLNALSKMFAREASLPDSAVAITDFANPTSAESYDASQFELVAEAEGAVDDFDRPISRSIRRGLAILNQVEEPSEWRTIGPRWRNPKFESRAAQADAGLKQITAVPWLAETTVALELLGLTEDQKARALADRRRSQGRDILEQVAPAAAVDARVAQESAAEMKAKFDALGVAIRSGVDPADAATRLGLSGIEFTGATPVSLRLPEQDAARLEDK